jgi:hypothetical protein
MARLSLNCVKEAVSLESSNIKGRLFNAANEFLDLNKLFGRLVVDKTLVHQERSLLAYVELWRIGSLVEPPRRVLGKDLAWNWLERFPRRNVNGGLSRPILNGSSANRLDG